MVWTIFCSRIHRFQTIWLKLREGDCTTNFGAISLSSWTSRNVPLFWLPCSVECNLSSCGNCCFLRRLDGEKTLTTKGGRKETFSVFQTSDLQVFKIWPYWITQKTLDVLNSRNWLLKTYGKSMNWEEGWQKAFHSHYEMGENCMCPIKLWGNDYYFLENK